MSVTEALFWGGAACVVYTYAGYPLGIGLAARLAGRPPRRGPFRGSVSFVVSAYNEEPNAARRLAELLGLAAVAGREAEVVWVSDGSTDRTAEVARSFPADRVRVVALPGNVGKAAALSEGVAAARGDVVVFADARQTWAPDALELLLENFHDPGIGGVSGDLVVEAAPGVMAGVGLYWRYEKWLREAEGRVHSCVGVTGAIAAVRRNLFRPIPQGVVLDDVYWPMNVVAQGYRVVHDARPRAFDRLPGHPRGEFRRKVRTLSGNYQLAARLPWTLVPWQNPVWVQFVSHKLFRLAAPWALVLTLVASSLLRAPLYRAAFWGQLAFYLVGIAGTRPGVASGLRLASVAGSFLVLNAAAWCAFWVWAAGRTSLSWKKVDYDTPVGAASP